GGGVHDRGLAPQGRPAARARARLSHGPTGVATPVAGLVIIRGATGSLPARVPPARADEPPVAPQHTTRNRHRRLRTTLLGRGPRWRSGFPLSLTRRERGITRPRAATPTGARPRTPRNRHAHLDRRRRADGLQARRQAGHPP